MGQTFYFIREKSLFFSISIQVLILCSLWKVFTQKQLRQMSWATRFEEAKMFKFLVMLQKQRVLCDYLFLCFVKCFTRKTPLERGS